MNSQLSRDTILQRADNGMLSTPLGEEMVMMDIESGNYLSLNRVARIIWDLLQQPVSIQTLMEQLTGKFDVTEAQCFEDCYPCLADMLEQKLICVC